MSFFILTLPSTAVFVFDKIDQEKIIFKGIKVVNMIKNKKLLIVTLIVMLVLCLSIDLPILLSGVIRTVGIEMSLFFIIVLIFF